MQPFGDHRSLLGKTKVKASLEMFIWWIFEISWVHVWIKTHGSDNQTWSYHSHSASSGALLFGSVGMSAWGELGRTSASSMEDLQGVWLCCCGLCGCWEPRILSLSSRLAVALMASQWPSLDPQVSHASFTALKIRTCDLGQRPQNQWAPPKRWDVQSSVEPLPVVSCNLLGSAGVCCCLLLYCSLDFFKFSFEVIFLPLLFVDISVVLIINLLAT